MRKRLLAPKSSTAHHGFDEERWLDLASLAEVEVTSEVESHPIESALIPGDNRGWRAATRGEQRIRLIFDQPQRISRILLVFEETEVARSHEFVLLSSRTLDGAMIEIVRQRWNFSPPNTAREVEDYRVQIDEIKVLELIILGIGDSDAGVSLRQLRIA